MTFSRTICKGLAQIGEKVGWMLKRFAASLNTDSSTMRGYNL